MSAPVAVIDALNGLLEAELNSVFRFMDEGSPYLSRANVEVRRPLLDMVKLGQRRTMELAKTIQQLGGTPLPPSIQPEEQYLAFLNLKFIIPKLVDAKKLIIQRYDNAIRALKQIASPDLLDMLHRHVDQMRRELEFLTKAVADMLTKK